MFHRSILTLSALSFLGFFGCTRFAEDKYVRRPGDVWHSERVIPAQALQKQAAGETGKLTLENGEKLDLARCVDFALKNNPRTRQAWLAAKAASANKLLVDSAFYPSLTAGLNGQRVSQPSIFAAGEQLKIDSYAPSLQISYILFNFGGNIANSQAAREAIYAANYSYNRTLQDIILAVAQSYYNLNAAEASVIASEFSVADSRQVYEASRLRTEAGLGTQQDVLRAEANLREAEFRLQADLASTETARAALAQVLGSEVNNRFDIAETSAPQSLENIEKDVAALTAEALRTRPDLLASYANAQSKEGTLRATRSALWPQLVFQFNGSLNSVRDRPGNPTEDWSAVLGLQWNIFDGFGKQARIKLAEADLASARESVRQSYYQVVSDVWSAFFALEAGQRQVVAARSQLQAATGSLELTQAGYQNGLNTLLELVSSQNDLASARLSKIQAETNFMVSLARVANAVGKFR